MKEYRKTGRRCGENRWQLLWACMLVLVVLWGGAPFRQTAALSRVQAAEETEEEEAAEEEVSPEQEEEILTWMEESVLDEGELQDLNRALEEMLPDSGVSFSQVLSSLIRGDGEETGKLLGSFFSDSLFYAVKQTKSTAGYLLAVIMGAALFGHCAQVFQSRQTADIAFYMMYILLITLCLKSFQLAAGTVGEGLEQLLTFMQILGPVYFLCMAVSTGSVTAVAFYNVVLLLIGLVETVIIRVLLPLIHVALLIRLMNSLTLESRISRFAELLETVVGWSLKTLLALVTGVGIVQGLLNPALDTVRQNALTRGLEMIPGIGDVAGGIGEVVLGTAVLIKNGTGVAGLICCVAVCLVPVVNMAVPALWYQCVAALAQPVSDRRITDALGSVASAYRMMLKLVLSTGVLFLLTIAVSAAFTG